MGDFESYYDAGRAAYARGEALQPPAFMYRIAHTYWLAGWLAAYAAEHGSDAEVPYIGGWALGRKGV